MYYYSHRPIELENLTVAEFYANYNVDFIKKNNNKSEIELNSDSSVASDCTNEQLAIEISLDVIYIKTKQSKIIRFHDYKIEDDEYQFYRSNVFLFHPWHDEEVEVEIESVKDVYLKNEIEITNKRNEFEKIYFDEKEIDKMAANLELSDEEELDLDENYFSDLLLELAPENGVIRGDEPARFAKVTIKTNTDYEELMIMLNTLQRRYLLNVLNKFKKNQLPIFDFISGGAGVGKSKLIDAIYQTLMREFTKPAGSKLDVIRILVTGPTGRAAFNVRGSTLHSAFSIGVVQAGSFFDNFDNPDVNGLLYSSLKNLKLLIIDEISMVGSSVFHKRDKRLRFIFKTNKSFGGISVICFGDFIQLKPVGDRYIFQSDKCNQN